jgi:choline dehydrogenase-like flavoprotein
MNKTKKNMKTKKNLSINDINSNDYKYIIVGCGLFGLLLAKLLSENNKVLLIEAGPIIYTKTYNTHLNRRNIYNIINDFPSKNSVWKIPYKQIKTSNNSPTLNPTPNPYIFGGRSLYWGGNANIPIYDDIKNESQEFIDNFYYYLNDAIKLLNLKTYKKPNWLYNFINKKDIFEASYALLNNVPLCNISDILHNNNITIISNCKIVKCLLENNDNKIKKVDGLVTSKGYINTKYSNVILSCGTFENNSILLASNINFNKLNNVIGTNFTHHLASKFVIRILKNSIKNIVYEPFILHPNSDFYVMFRYIKSNDNYAYINIAGFAKVYENYYGRRLFYNKKTKNDESNNLLLVYNLNKKDKDNWDTMDNYIDNFIFKFPSLELFIDNKFVKSDKIDISSLKDKQKFWINRRQPLISCEHESGGTCYGKVVNIHGQVKNISNLFINGPSVLPTIGGFSPCILTTCMLLNLYNYLIKTQ